MPGEKVEDWKKRAAVEEREVQNIKKRLKKYHGGVFDEYGGLGADKANKLRQALEIHRVAWETYFYGHRKPTKDEIDDALKALKKKARGSMEAAKVIGRQLWKRGERRLAQALVEAAKFNWMALIPVMETQLINAGKQIDSGRKSLRSLKGKATRTGDIDTVEQVFNDLAGIGEMGLKYVAQIRKDIGSEANAADAGKTVRVQDDYLADTLRDITSNDPQTVRAWKKNQDLKHYEQTVERHGEENVGICEACWRGALKAKAVTITNGTDDFFMGPICWKKFKGEVAKL